MPELAETIAEANRLGAEASVQPENVPAVLFRLLEMLHAQSAPTVLDAVINALGCAWDEHASLAVLPFADHHDDHVRLAVARVAPSGVESDAAQEAIAAALIPLSGDAVEDVRDWATFGLGSILDIDSQAVRTALAARLDDAHFDTSCEALVGLAKRKDARAFERTLALLQEGSVPRLAVASARALGDSRLVPYLQELQRWWDVDPSLLAAAIEASEGSKTLE
ncbi:MAG: hypothetical protein ACR2G7_06975 [Acidimicrobiales bacterium]